MAGVLGLKGDFERLGPCRIRSHVAAVEELPAADLVDAFSWEKIPRTDLCLPDGLF